MQDRSDDDDKKRLSSLALRNRLTSRAKSLYLAHFFPKSPSLTLIYIPQTREAIFTPFFSRKLQPCSFFSSQKAFPTEQILDNNYKVCLFWTWNGALAPSNYFSSYEYSSLAFEC